MTKHVDGAGPAGCSTGSPPPKPPPRGGSRPDPVLNLAQLDQAVGAFITGTYLPREHPELGDSPLRVWVADGWLPRLPATLDELDGLLLTVAKPRVVHPDGINQRIATVATYLPDTAAPARPPDDNPSRPPRRRLRTYYEDP